jgi:hypothetical protein
MPKLVTGESIISVNSQNNLKKAKSSHRNQTPLKSLT